MADARTLMIVVGVVFALLAVWVVFARRGKKLPEAKTDAKTLPKGGAAAGAKALPASSSAAQATTGKTSNAGNKKSAGADTAKAKSSDGNKSDKGGKSAKSEPAKVEAKPAAKVEPKAGPKVEAKAAEPKAEPKPEPKPEPKVEAKAEPKPEPKPEPKVEAKPVIEAKPEPKPEPKAAPAVEAKAEPKPAPKPAEAKPAPTPAAAKVEPVKKAEPTPQPKPAVEAKPVAKAEPAPAPKAEPKPEPKVEAKPAAKAEPAPAAAAKAAPTTSTAKVEAAAAAAKASPVELKKVESVRPALSSHHEIQDTAIPAAADVPLAAPAFSFTTAAARWQPESAKDSGDAHATLLEEHLFVMAANRNGAQGSAAIKALREAKGSSGWRSVLASKGAESTPTVAAFFPGGGTSVELSRIGDGQGFRLRGGTLTKITGEGSAREVEKKTEQVDVGDLYILCSAELARTVPEEEIRELLMLDLDPTNGVRDLLAISGDRDPNADVNVFVVRVDPLGGY